MATLDARQVAENGNDAIAGATRECEGKEPSPEGFNGRAVAPSDGRRGIDLITTIETSAQ